MTLFKKIFVSILVCFIFIFTISPFQTSEASSSFAFVILSQNQTRMDIGEEYHLIAITSNFKKPTWKSSNSSVASVNTYGKIIAKKAGTATITAKIRNAEATCRVTVTKTTISINNTKATLERGKTLKLSATTSNGSPVVWKSKKKSVATVDEMGLVTAMNPGETTITATADGSKVTCKIVVKTPAVKLNKSKLTLYRGQTARLTATVSSGIQPVWKTNKKSVVVVERDGTITAIKHGTAIITATVDGVSKRCEIIVKQPTITLSHTELELKKGEVFPFTATVSSGNIPLWSTSNSNILNVDEDGNITALQKGRAYVYASEDGIKVRCTVYVTE